MLYRLLLILLLIGGFSIAAYGQFSLNQNYVHISYLSPSDQPYNPSYAAEITTAAVELQSWFASQLGGRTFTLDANPVHWFQLSHPVSYYQQESGAAYSAGRFWESGVKDAFSLTGGGFYDPDDIWVYFLDADALSGQYYGGTSSVALLTANDLRGLDGQPLVVINPGDPSVNPGFDRYVGGLGHELGHAFGLDHPKDSPGGTDDDSLMYWGYLPFPNTYLRPSDRSFLLSTPFFGSLPVPEPSPCALLLSALFFGQMRRRKKREISPSPLAGMVAAK